MELNYFVNMKNIQYSNHNKTHLYFKKLIHSINTLETELISISVFHFSFQFLIYWFFTDGCQTANNNKHNTKNTTTSFSLLFFNDIYYSQSFIYGMHKKKIKMKRMLMMNKWIIIFYVYNIIILYYKHKIYILMLSIIEL